MLNRNWQILKFTIKRLYLIIALVSMNEFIYAQCSYSNKITQINLVTNGDFSSGNTGFSSDLTYSTANPLLEDKYVLTTNASLVHFGYTGTDHTTGTGNFMVINQGINPIIWKQSIAVSPSKTYLFAAWFKNVVKLPDYAGLPTAKMELWINGTKISSTLNVTDGPDVWRLLEANWNAGTATTANLEIRNTETLLNGNDYGIDDVTFKDCCQDKVEAGIDQTICLGDSAVISATGVGNYVWSPVFYINNINVNNPTVRPPVTARYYVTLTNGICVSKDTILITVEQVSANAGIDQKICAGDSIQLNGKVVATKWEWIPTTDLRNPLSLQSWMVPKTSTKLILKAEITNCIRYDTVDISFINNINANAGNDTFICSGNPIQLKASGGNTYLWLTNYQINDVNSANPIVNPKIDTSYIVRVQVGSNCFGYDTIFVAVNGAANIELGEDLGHCFDGAVQIPTVFKTAVDSFVWSPQTGLNNIKIERPFAAIKGKQTFTLTAYKNSCISKDSLLVFEMPKITAKFTTNPQNAIAPSYVQFINQSVNGTRFSWEFGDGSFPSQEVNPVHYYKDTGEFIARLFAIDSLECADRAIKTITLVTAPYLKLPNAITINGDGINEKFIPVFNEEAFLWLKYTIYDRWGNEIFYTEYPNANWWDGTADGEPCQSGTYFYKLDAIGRNNEPFNLKGTIDLLR
jgi:gliding motility-associated-like protein